jgi:hypothetical protein
MTHQKVRWEEKFSIPANAKKNNLKRFSALESENFIAQGVVIFPSIFVAR